jgi:hypothetical protein
MMSPTTDDLLALMVELGAAEIVTKEPHHLPEEASHIIPQITFQKLRWLITGVLFRKPWAKQGKEQLWAGWVRYYIAQGNSVEEACARAAEWFRGTLLSAGPDRLRQVYFRIERARRAEPQRV